MSANLQATLKSIDSKLKSAGSAVAEVARGIASDLIDEAKIIVDDAPHVKVYGGAHGVAEQKAEKLMRHAEEHKKMSEASADEAEKAFGAIAKLTNNDAAKKHIEAKIMPKIEEERSKWKTAKNTTFLNAYDSLQKFYASLKEPNATVAELQLGLTHLAYYLVYTLHGVVPGAQGAQGAAGTTPQSVYESAVIRAIKDDIYNGRGHLRSLDRNQLLAELQKSYEAITSNQTDAMTRNEYIITIESIVKAINDLTTDKSSRFGGSIGAYSLIPENSEFTVDLVKVRLGILSIYSKLNTLYDVAKKINAGTTMTEQQETRFVRSVARIEEYVTMANIKRDMLFRISPVESILYSRVMTEITTLRDITDPDVVKFLAIVEQALAPLLANNAVSSNHINDFVIDIGVDAIELDTRVFKLIREIAYKRRLVGFVDISQNSVEIKANLANQVKQFTQSEKTAISRAAAAAPGAAPGAVAWNDDTVKAITQLSNASIQLDYMTQLMNYEATSEPASADTVYNAIFRSKNRVHDNLSYEANPVTSIQNATINGKISTEAVREILPEIENMINIFARVTKSKEFSGPKEIADAMYRFIALEDTANFGAQAATLYKKTNGESFDVRLGNILRLFVHYNSHSVNIGNVINPDGIYARFADFNDQHGSFGGSFGEREKYGDPIDAQRDAIHNTLSKEALEILANNQADIETVDGTHNAAAGQAAGNAANGVQDGQLATLIPPGAVNAANQYLITLPVALAAFVSGNVFLAPLFSRLLFGPNVFVEDFCSAVVAYCTDNALSFVPRDEGTAGGIYDFRASEVTFRFREGNGIKDVVSLAITRDPKDSVHRDNVRQDTENLLNGFIANKQLSFVSEDDFHERKTLVFLLLQHFEVSTDINARRRGENADLAKMIRVVEQSRIRNTAVSLISDEEIVTLYYNLALEASRITRADDGSLVYTDEGVSFPFSIPTANFADCDKIMAIALEKITSKYGRGSESLTQFDVHILGSRREADFISQNALQPLNDINAMINHEVPYISLARAIASFAKTFALDMGTPEAKDIVNNTLHLLHSGDRAGRFHAAQTRHGALPGNVGAPVAPVAPVVPGAPGGQVIPYPNAPFVKDIFVLWNQYNLLNNIYLTLGGSTGTSMDMLISDMNVEIRKANIPVIHGDEKTTIANNIFTRYVAMLKLIVGRIFSVVDKNLIESNVGKSSSLERYKLGVAELFGGADFSYNRENKDKYIKFILLAEWYFTFFKSKDMFDIKPFILKESGPFRGLNEAVFAKVYDNVAYNSVALGKIVGSVNVDGEIQHYIEAINRAIGFYIFSTVDKSQGASAGSIATRFDDAVTSANIFSGIPNKLPLASTFDLDVANANNVVKSRYDLSVTSSFNNISEMYARNDRLVKLLADINSGFENIDLSKHDEFALANITETFNKKVQGKTVDQESVAFLDFINTIDSFEFSNKQNIVSNFINVPIKLADDLALLFEDDYNELVIKSNYGKLKNLIVGNDTLFKLDFSGKEARFTSHIPTMITTLLDIASGSLIKYSGYVDYSKLGDIEKQISFAKRKRDMIATRLNNSEFNARIIENMLPHVIMELYKDHMSVYAPGVDSDGNPIPDPAWVGRQGNVRSGAEGHRGRGIPRTVFEHGRVARAVETAFGILSEARDAVTSSTAARARAANAGVVLNPKPEVTDFETAVARTIAIGKYLSKLSSALEDGVQHIDAIIDIFNRVVKAEAELFANIRNNMIFGIRSRDETRSSVTSRNRANLLNGIQDLRVKAAARATSTDYIFFDFYTNEQIADKVLTFADTPTNHTKKSVITVQLAEIKHDLDTLDNPLRLLAGAIAGSVRTARARETAADVVVADNQQVPTGILERVVRDAEVELGRYKAEHKRVVGEYNNGVAGVTRDHVIAAEDDVRVAKDVLDEAIAALDAAINDNDVRAAALPDAQSKQAKAAARATNTTAANAEVARLDAVFRAKPPANGNYDNWTAWGDQVDQTVVNVAIRRQGFQVDQNPATPIDSGSNMTIRRALNGAHGPHRQFYQVYHMMFLLYSSTSDTKLKNLMRSLLHHVSVQETFSSFSKSILNQLDFGGSYDDFVRTKDCRTVAGLGDFSTAIDFKGTEFNKIRLGALLGTAVIRDMMGLMSVNQTGFSSSKSAEENVKDIVHKASAIAIMLRNAMGTLGVKANLFDMSKVSLIQPVEIGGQANYKDYGFVNIDLLCSGVFGTKALNSRDICSTINFIETHCGDKAKADSLRAKHREKPCQTACLVPAATVTWNGASAIDFNSWLRKGLPTSLYTHNKDMLASISDRMDKMIVYVQATIANILRVFGKGSRLVAPPIAVPAEYTNIVSAVTSAAHSGTPSEGLTVADVQDKMISRVAEALFTKARVLDIPVFVPFKNEYSPAELVMIARSDFAVTSPDAVTCRNTISALGKITGQTQQRAVAEILLTPGSATASVVTLPGITGVNHADVVERNISPTAVTAINEVSGAAEYGFVAFNETNSAETLVATALVRKLHLVLNCRFPCSIHEYVSILNDLGNLLVTTKTGNKNIWSYLMSRIKALTCEARSSPAKDLVNKYVVVLGNAIACVERHGGEHVYKDRFGGSGTPESVDGSDTPDSVDGSDAPESHDATRRKFGGSGAPESYGAIRHQFGSFGGSGAPESYGAIRHQFGGSGAPESYGAIRHQFGGSGAPESYGAIRHQFGGSGAPEYYADFRNQFGGSKHGRPSNVYASQTPAGTQADMPDSVHDFLADIHHNFISGSKVTDLAKNTKDLEMYVTRQDAASNLPAMHNVLTNLNRVVTAIAQLSNEWLTRSRRQSTAYSRNVEEYRKVCISIKSFTENATNMIAKELNSDLSIGEALKSLVRNVNHNDMGVKHIYDVIMSDVHAILPRVAINGSPFAYMSPVFNAVFYADITGSTEVLPPIREIDNSAIFLFSCISNIANVRLAKNLAFGKRYEKLPYSNTLSADDRSVSRNILYLNNIIDININPIKLSYMKQAPLFYSTEVFSRVFDRAVREYINNAFNSFSAAEKGIQYKVVDPTNAAPAGIDKTLKENYDELIEFLVDPFEFYKVHRVGANSVVLPEEFKNGVTRGRNFQGQAQIYGHPIPNNGNNIGTNLLYFWTKEVYKFMRNFLVDRISHAGDAGEIGINRGLNALIRNEHIFR